MFNEILPTGNKKYGENRKENMHFNRVNKPLANGIVDFCKT